ncbi:TIGR03759 family integrating conjugative element protein (plasmid) [Legionella sp. PC1000]|uniref:TIGR03759 family integrating conjugative element protein n=1 Tax=Legionella sp. PC1000 TaxID=2746060 RepID=UPI0015FBD4DC|nr:TIGR03759 family integrating conjugative element protein [Legionella sp. PC1000]QLZ70964.1 TIGR03759 family integrating conjugative element protein [Legionella sp. PC1000]
MSKKSLLLSLMFLNVQAHADLTIPGIVMHHNNSNALASTDKTLAKTGLSVNEDDITAEQDMNTLKLTPLQLHEARVWGLTEEEEKRYVFLMQNRSAVYYKGLRQTPVDVLGINAKGEAERAHFAVLSARHEAQKVSKNIAWNNAFYKAYNQLFANVPVVGEFDASPYSPVAYKPIRLNEGDTLFLFIKTDDAIKTVLLTLMEAINASSNTRLHLMLMGMDDNAVQVWANLNQIPRELVSNGTITLNHGELSFDALNAPKKTTPLLLLARGGASSVVDLGVF